MRNCLIIIGILLFYLLIGSLEVEAIKIPDEAIRIRIVPNSNSLEDQDIKNKVKMVVEEEVYNLLKDTKGIEDAREKIDSNISVIDKKVNDVLFKNNYNLGYKINFGYNYFPEKDFNGIKYKEGMYESLLITLGKGEGDNWWCVLFPPLCLLEAEEGDKVEYKLFVKELLDKYL